MISFRVSPDEYDRLRNACAAEGVGTVSELARAAIDGMIRRNEIPRSVGDELADLRQRVESLAAEVDRLARSHTVTPSNGACAD